MSMFNVIVVGCGVISVKWFDHMVKRDDVSIVALCDKNVAQAEKMRERYRLDCPIYDSAEVAFDTVSANLLIDLTYVTAHYDIVTRALKAGMNVFGEKPMAFTPDQVNDMLRTVEQTGKRYIVMQNRRYIEQVRRIRGLIDSGIMGKPVLISGSIFVGADMASIRNQLKYPQLQDNNIHVFDQARYMAHGNPISAYYHSFNPAGSKYVDNAAGVGVFEFADGCVFCFQGYNGAEGCHTTWDHDWRLVCERGTCLWPGQGDVTYEYANKVGVYKYKKGTLHAPVEIIDQHDMALEDMFDALRTGRTADTECWDNAHSIAMIFACVKSAEERRKVKIQINSSYPYIELI
jgi:predicted dehydrogenase